MHQAKALDRPISNLCLLRVSEIVIISDFVKKDETLMQTEYGIIVL